jgi:glycerol-1-phosphate dehydrogenase [NAD(P)+]
VLAVYGARLPSYECLLARIEPASPSDVTLILAPYVNIQASRSLTEWAPKVAKVTHIHTMIDADAQIELALRNADQVVMAVGGGSFLDRIKLLCCDRNRSMVGVGSNVASDVAGSPLVSRYGAITARVDKYHGAIDLALARHTGNSSRLAGLGDLLSNIVAVRDWTNSPNWDASAVYLEAAQLSTRSVDRLVHDKSIDLTTDAGVDSLAACLLASGRAMELAGCSAPASGGCHRVGRALQKIIRTPERHGNLALMGAVVIDELWNRSRGTSTTVRTAAENFGINVVTLFARICRRNDFKRAIELARHARIDRWSILDTYDSTDRILHAVERTGWYRILKDD